MRGTSLKESSASTDIIRMPGGSARMGRTGDGVWVSSSEDTKLWRGLLRTARPVRTDGV